MAPHRGQKCRLFIPFLVRFAVDKDIRRDMEETAEPLDVRDREAAFPAKPLNTSH